MTDDFDWQPLGQQWWLDTAKQFGASDRQTRFAVAKFRNCSNTEAARQAGYVAADPGQLRTTAHRLSKSNIVAKLLAFASAEAGGTGYDGNVNRDEARSILSRLARQSDPNIKIRACEQLAKFDEADRQQREVKSEISLEQAGREILEVSPEYGLIILADNYFSKADTLWGMPFLAELAPLLKRDYPTAWQRYIDATPSVDHRRDLEQLAAGPLLTVEQALARSPEDDLRRRNLSFINNEPTKE